MNYSRLKVWCIVTLSLVVIAIVIRAVWQIVVIPTPKTMLIFMPLIIALIGSDVLISYLVFKPGKIKSLPFTIGLTVTFGAGLLAGVVHFYRFIISTQADPFFSKVISWMIILSSASAYFIFLYVIWSLRKAKDNGQRKV